MSEKPLSDALGIDQAAEEALARADVRTLRELNEADPEALAMASGIPLDRIKDWQERARRAGARRKRNPVVTGWLVAVIGLAIAVALGWGMMSIGAARLKNAEQIRLEAESKLQMEIGFGARRAIDELLPVRLALHSNNWGAASDALSPVEDCAEFIQRIAPEGRLDSVAQVSKKLDDLQSAIRDQSKDAMDRLTALEAALNELAQAE
ncbi:MAG: hypothetical protein JSV79_08705 [Armatimonadota bacterium]|nr:MAG: hypothetical protein JSV79_08705 [Armatimonadota bacterium]